MTYSPVIPPIPADGRILYFGRDREDFDYLSNFYPVRVSHWYSMVQQYWPSVEHYYQWHKSDDLDYCVNIMSAPTAQEAKRLGTAVSEGRGPVFLHSEWYNERRNVMRYGMWLKFTHPRNRDLRTLLLATEEAALVNDSPTDDYWGIGPDGQGHNWAGRLLMSVRTQLRSESEK